MRFQAVNLKYDNSKDAERKRSLWESKDVTLDYSVNGAELIDKKTAERIEKRTIAAREIADAKLRDELTEVERKLREAEDRANELELEKKRAETENARLADENARRQEETRKAKLEAERAKLNAAHPTPPPNPSYAATSAHPAQPTNNKSNGFAVVGFLLAFFGIQPFGLIVSIIGRNKAVKEGCPHGGLAIAGIVLSALQIAAVAVYIIATVTSAILPLLFFR